MSRKAVTLRDVGEGGPRGRVNKGTPHAEHECQSYRRSPSGTHSRDTFRVAPKEMKSLANR